MQEEVNEKTISLCIKGGKITAQILKAALIKLLAEMDKKKQRGKGAKIQCKKTGRQSIKSLQKSGAQITNIVVTDNNIKSFDRVARKWNVDYTFYQVAPDKHLLFFKAGQADAITACFSEYSKRLLKRTKSTKAPIREQIKEAATEAARQPAQKLERTKEAVHEDR